MQEYISKVKIKDGISILKVHGSTPGVELAKREIYKIIDERTALFLSGGSTPKHLYQILTKERKLKVGAVAMVDERFGLPFHQNSNEKMIRETGFLSYLEEKKIPFYSILRFHPKGVASDIARDYDEVIQGLFKKFQKRVAILGIGADGHVAGIPPRSEKLSPQMRDPAEAGKFKSEKFAAEIDNFPGEFKKRITLTLNALSKMDLLMVLVFGEEKREALKLLFSKGSIAEVPARFFKTPEISQKTLLITDQKV
ncbi:MAG: 6-phosphogluconolactonase [Patescibacteria group bacterium]